MNRASLLITLLMGALTVLLWGLVNRPDIEPPWPNEIEGFAFSPMRGEQNPREHQYPEVGQIDADLSLLEGRPMRCAPTPSKGRWRRCRAWQPSTA